jgi:hypothetical protein
MSVRRILLLDMLDKNTIGHDENSDEEEQINTIWMKVKERVTLLFNDIEEDFAQYYFAGSPYKIWLPLFILVVGFTLVTTIILTVDILKFALLVVGVFTFGLVFFFTCHFKDDLYYVRKREVIMLACILVVEICCILVVSIDRKIGYPIA